jgi:hypothetical protein
VSPVSCKRVIRVDVRAPFVGGRLGAQRHAQKYLRVICRTRSPVDYLNRFTKHESPHVKVTSEVSVSRRRRSPSARSALLSEAPLA